MVAGRQTCDERDDLSVLGIHDHDTRAVVLLAGDGRADGLVRVRGEEPSALEALLERDVDRRPVGQEASAVGQGLGERATEQLTALVEDQDVGREGVGRRELAPECRTRLIVAAAGQAVSGLENEHFEPSRIAAERDGSREVQAAFEHRDLEAWRYDDVLTVARIEEDVLTGAERIAGGHYEGGLGK